MRLFVLKLNTFIPDTEDVAVSNLCPLTLWGKRKKQTGFHVHGKNDHEPAYAAECIYLYLTTIGETPSCRNVTKRIHEIYLKYPNHPVLIWILLRTDEACA
ncbi:MAG: hypothetical protein ACLUD0_10550 [Eubacterium ramulus]